MTWGATPTRALLGVEPLHAVKAARDKGNWSLSEPTGTHFKAIQPNKVYEATFWLAPSSNERLK